MKCKVCSNFQVSFLHLSQTYPTVEASNNQEQYYFRSSWHLVILWVRMTFSQTYPTSLVEASGDQGWYYVRSSWHLVILWVRLTFSQMYPPVEHLVAKNGTNIGPVDLNTDKLPPCKVPSPKSSTTSCQLAIWSDWAIVKCTPWEASSDQEQY